MLLTQTHKICMMFVSETGRYRSALGVLELLHRGLVRPSIGRLQDRLDHPLIHTNLSRWVDILIGLRESNKTVVPEVITVL